MTPDAIPGAPADPAPVDPATAAAEAHRFRRSADRAQFDAGRYEETLRGASARRISFVWEATQALIAVAVIGVALYVDARVALQANKLTDLQLGGLMQLNVMATLVTGFYFGRSLTSAPTGGRS